MIQLTEKVFAVEVPSDATDILLIHDNTRLAYFHPNYKRIDLDCRAESLIGITPLSEEQWKEVVGSHTSSETMYCDRTPYVIPVSPKDRWNDLQRHKGLDVNKKYAIIKIEK